MVKKATYNTQLGELQRGHVCNMIRFSDDKAAVRYQTLRKALFMDHDDLNRVTIDYGMKINVKRL